MHIKYVFSEIITLTYRDKKLTLAIPKFEDDNTKSNFVK